MNCGRLDSPRDGSWWGVGTVHSSVDMIIKMAPKVFVNMLNDIQTAPDAVAHSLT
jgi:hypothetical protein